jgi:hypothetical protein
MAHTGLLRRLCGLTAVGENPGTCIVGALLRCY